MADTSGTMDRESPVSDDKEPPANDTRSDGEVAKPKDPAKDQDAGTGDKDGGSDKAEANERAAQ